MAAGQSYSVLVTARARAQRTRDSEGGIDSGWKT
jgi:hypothetical protein